MNLDWKKSSLTKLTTELETPFHYHIVLIEPEIPPNTGNAGRLCVATNSTLHLVGKLGFNIDDKTVRRAGLDYWKYVDLHRHETFEDWLAWHQENEKNTPFFLISENEKRSLYDVAIPPRAAFLFGKETLGFPPVLMNTYAEKLTSIPMFSPKIRSLNLSNAISITLYEAIRQQIQSEV